MNATAELSAVVDAIRENRERRDELIRQRRAEGASLRAIAAEARIHHSTVDEILRGKSSD